jgi:hypothetical protein
MKALINGMDLAYQCAWEVSSDPIDVTPSLIVKPDMKWSHSDSKGHYHAFSEDKEENLPTLFRRQIEHEHSEPADEDGFVETWTNIEVTWHCRICEEVVNPKWNEYTNTHRVLAPGRMSWRVDLRVVGSNTRLVKELTKTQVSVQVIEGDYVLFGVGMLDTTGVAKGDDDHIRWFGSVYGNGPLGRRKVTA